MAAAEGFIREHCLGATAAPHYRRWQHELVAPHLGRTVLEVGSGMGHFSALLVAGDRDRVVLTDTDVECLARLRTTYGANPRVDVRTLSLPHGVAIDQPVESIVAMNVLEHVDDDVQALRDLAAVVAPGGRIAIWVPAHAALYGEFDRRVGHVRRYTRRSLVAAMQGAGLRVVSVRSVNLLGAVAWWMAVRVRGVGHPRPGLIAPYDNLLVPFSRFLERFVRPPFGQSVLGIAEVPRS